MHVADSTDDCRHTRTHTRLCDSISMPFPSSRGVGGARVKPNRAPSAGPTPWTDRLLTLPPDVLTCCVERLFTHAVEANEALRSSCKGTITRFHAKEPPNLALQGYLSRLIVYMPCPRDAILLTVLYLDRISRLRPPAPYHEVTSVPLLPTVEPTRAEVSSSTEQEHKESESLAHPLINTFTIHRLVLAALLVACKSECDGHLSQRRVAKVGGVTMRELIQLEVDVLALLDWRLTYTLNAVEDLSRTLWELAQKEGLITADADDPSPISSSSAPSVAEVTAETSAGPRLQGVPLVSVSTPNSHESDDRISVISTSTASSVSVSPCMRSPARDSSISPSPPSSNEASTRSSLEDSRKSNASGKNSTSLQGQRLASRASSETVRRLDRLSVS
ncbi:BZ3500_MvSof-1268-A1-R1_Chr1-3g01647 [Microbotryum saponariae]|uniref:BZ3500_MvSof-1268-A1-R1_Chr1-3g01647 protein n=1 Tax=Microbotryum saponariae TaxID=289078 RepID=A0A2X0L637_9BASI|nr:BZ3500_MvSof-1268-A1-R1_Chr1-3g01647 [Microbotryum saponariae]SCZ94231.1 BZ3501_MvSof-1269-A2-R1_Chr1-3g01248 [Microbotryum saponariae]